MHFHKLHLSVFPNSNEQDLNNNRARGDKESYLARQEQIAVVYSTKLTNEWYKALMKVEKVGSQTIDRNAKVVEMTNKFDVDFKGLSKTAQVIATINFLQGSLNLSNSLAEKRFDKIGRTRIVRAIPPASRSKNELQLLDASVLFKYYKEYNEIVNKPSETTLRNQSKSRNYTTWHEIIKRVCN